MGTRRLVLALVVAIVISLVITSLFYIRVARQEAANRIKSRRIVAAAVALEPGTPITADSLTEVNWPDGVPLDGLIEQKQDVMGHFLVYAVAANEPILKRDLAASASFGLSAKIPDGMRATAVKANEDINIAGYIFPGSHVDVLATLRGQNGNNSNTLTRTVLQNVEVLSTGAKMEPDPEGKPDNVTVVTLLVTPEQSEKLALAQNEGTLRFALRNGADDATPDTAPVNLNELMDGSKPVQTTKPAKVQVKVEKIEPVKPQPPPTYSVETVANGKISVAQFPDEESK